MYMTGPCKVTVVEDAGKLFEMGERLTAYPPFTWILMTITEGKYHQVRKMIAALRHRCKRLIRVSIEGLELGDMKPGAVKEILEEELFKLLKINSQ